MHRGYRHIVLAVGLVLYASLAYSQDQPDAALESDPIAISTALVAAFTGILAVSTIGLWIATVCANKRHAREMHVVQRAYVAVEPGGVKMIDDPGGHAIADIDIKNAGRLPARNLKWVIKSIFSENDRLKEFPFVASKSEGENTLPPGSVMTQGSPAFEAGRMQHSPKDVYLYIWGGVFYEDGFSRPRETRFCHRYHCVNFKVRSISPEVARFHRYGNEAS